MKSFFVKGFIALWLLTLSGLGIYYILFAPAESSYSEEENRTLAGFPEFTLSTLISGDFMEGIENYLLDRFPSRTNVIAATNKLKSTVSLASYEEYVLVADKPEDALDSDVYLENLDSLLAGLDQNIVTPSPTPTSAPTPTSTPTPTPPEVPIVTEHPQSADITPNKTFMPTGMTW